MLVMTLLFSAGLLFSMREEMFSGFKASGISVSFNTEENF